MQRLMGITHLCSGAIFARTIHTSPARLKTADFINLRIAAFVIDPDGCRLEAHCGQSAS
jgi:hypothetical protein